MTLYKGDFLGTETIPFPISTNDGSGGRIEPSTAFEVADFRIYKQVSATQRSSEVGYAIAPAFDAMVDANEPLTQRAVSVVLRYIANSS